MAKDKRWILDELHSLGYLPHYFLKAVYKGLSLIRELTKAGALIAAEIDRLQAIEGKKMSEIDVRLMDGCTIPSQKAIWLNAENHGWHNPACDMPTDLLLIHSEVSEACEALRKGNMAAVEEELADVIIRVFHVAEKNGFDIEKAVWEKHYKNINRPYRHGNKKF